jgi:hypothetical protein
MSQESKPLQNLPWQFDIPNAIVSVTNNLLGGETFWSLKITTP